MFLSVQTFYRAGALGALLAALSANANANANAQPPRLAAAYETCLTQARAGTRGPSAHAARMVAACKALAAQAGQPGRVQAALEVAAACHDAAGQGHPPRTSPYKRQFRDIHKIQSRAACANLKEAVLANEGGRQP